LGGERFEKSSSRGSPKGKKEGKGDNERDHWTMSNRHDLGYEEIPEGTSVFRRQKPQESQSQKKKKKKKKKKKGRLGGR